MVFGFGMASGQVMHCGYLGDVSRYMISLGCPEVGLSAKYMWYEFCDNRLERGAVLIVAINV